MLMLHCGDRITHDDFDNRRHYYLAELLGHISNRLPNIAPFFNKKSIIFESLLFIALSSIVSPLFAF
ncbi:Uncharacterised protein [Shigella flexneri]|nr:Uncharacterised protein [Shigella flexneri]